MSTDTLHLQSIDVEALKASASKASALLKSLSHADRLLLLCQLVESEACVRDLEQSTGIKQPSLSQQLGVLRENGLVNTRREGRQIFIVSPVKMHWQLCKSCISVFVPPTNSFSGKF